MTKPMLLADFQRLPPRVAAAAGAGLSAVLDDVAAHGPASHAFLRYQWFAAAVAAYGGAPATVVATQDGRPVLALPLVPLGPRLLGLVAVPGSYWPFRSFPAALEADDAARDALLDAIARQWRGVRIGPSPDGDASVAPLVARARARGWTVLERAVAESWVLDIAGAPLPWPRASTLRKNRFHEKHLAAHGALDWRFLDGAALADGGFAALAAVEQKSWIAARTDGRDAKFTAAGHGAFWQVVAADPVLAAMLSAALLTVDGVAAAFSFDLDAGATRYAIANSYDPAFAKHSPGKLLQWRNLARAAERGIATVDWGAGDSGYKQTIGAVAGPVLRDWLLLRPGWSGRTAATLARRWFAAQART